MNPGWMEARWPAPAYVRAGTTLRTGGFSEGPYATLNLGTHVGDDDDHVLANRRLLREALDLPAEPRWLTQEHGNRIVTLDANPETPIADGALSTKTSAVCAVLTADCLPVLLCHRYEPMVAALHAGWRGLAAGILEAGLCRFSDRHILAWLGPYISQPHYAVGPELREIFLARSTAFMPCFAHTGGRWRADLAGIARVILRQNGITAIYGGAHCSYAETEKFFSYRRDGTTGRMASLIWITRSRPQHLS